MKRFFVKFPTSAIAGDLVKASAPSENSAEIKRLFTQPNVIHAPLNDRQRLFFEREGAVIYDDIQLSVMPGLDGEERPQVAHRQGAGSTKLSLADVVEAVKAPRAWARTRGAGATIVIVDQGISPGLRELPSIRRSSLDVQTYYGGQHWIDGTGHGSMCAAIAAGSVDAGGRYDGIAPAATVVSARTNLFTTDLIDIYDALAKAQATGDISGPFVISNSFGFETCQAPASIPVDHPYIGAIIQALNRGFFVCFAAGNNHRDLCGHKAEECCPNTIWGPNSLDGVISVGAVNSDFSNRDPSTPHSNSSRGPGQWSIDLPKPDCVAPTYGEVPWGSTYRVMSWWGTSGACPQAAGLAALIFSVAPKLRPEDVGEIIRLTCDSLSDGAGCVGHGLINCEAAVDMAVNYPQASVVAKQ